MKRKAAWLWPDETKTEKKSELGQSGTKRERKRREEKDVKGKLK